MCFLPQGPSISFADARIFFDKDGKIKSVPQNCTTTLQRTSETPNSYGTPSLDFNRKYADERQIIEEFAELRLE